MSTVFVWVLMAVSIDPLKPECPHHRTAAVYATQEACKAADAMERAAGSEAVWECAKMQVRKK
jgi:hypothetical protein